MLFIQLPEAGALIGMTAGIALLSVLMATSSGRGLSRGARQLTAHASRAEH